MLSVQGLSSLLFSASGISSNPSKNSNSKESLHTLSKILAHVSRKVKSKGQKLGDRKWSFLNAFMERLQDIRDMYHVHETRLKD